MLVVAGVLAAAALGARGGIKQHLPAAGGDVFFAVEVLLVGAAASESVPTPSPGFTL